VTSVALGEGRIAVGLSAGAVRVVDPNLQNPVTVWDAAFGASGRIWSLAWHRGNLWIAAGKGLFQYDANLAALDKLQRNVPESIRSGTRVLREQGDALWCASSTQLVRIGDPKRGEYQQWNLPVADDPTTILKTSSRILVGTSSKGLLLLDSATGEWTRFGKAEGLSSDQVTGLEWIGDQVYIGTPDGIDAMDLSSREIHVVVPSLMVAWMTQINGALMGTSLEGLFRVEPGTFQLLRAVLPEGAQAEGSLSFGMGLLAVGGHSELLVREESSILGREGLRVDPDGFRIALPGALPQGAQLQAFLRIPEWPAAKVPMEVVAPRTGRDWLVKMPLDIRGNVQVDLLVLKDGRTVEVRSLEGSGDRAKPVLEVATLPRAVRDSEIEVSGTASGIGALKLSLRQESVQKLSMDSTGTFRRKVLLRPGENRIEVALEDGIGNRVARVFSVRRVDRVPEFGTPAFETVDAEFARIRVPFRGQGAVKVGIRPDSSARATVFDSFVVVDVRGLSLGDNSWSLAVEDEVGNVATAPIHVFRKARGTAASLDSALTAAQKTSAARARGDSAVAGSGTPRAAGLDEPHPVRGGDPSIHVVRYRMLDGETIRKVSEKFYGTRDLDTVLIRWNGFIDSSQWRKMPIGTLVEVPIWMDFDQAKVSVRKAITTFPWDKIPIFRRGRK
jgi:hypothetical protein